MVLGGRWDLITSVESGLITSVKHTMLDGT